MTFFELVVVGLLGGIIFGLWRLEKSLAALYSAMSDVRGYLQEIADKE
jgi:hypothetical protein